MVRKKNKKYYKKYLIILWSVFVFVFLSIVLLFISTYYGLLGDLPSISEIENFESKQASEIYSSDGELLGKYYVQNRSLIDFEFLSPYLVNALLATEDERFYKHSGIDFKGTARALYYLGKKGGASTITQQLAKNLYTGLKSRSFLSRLKEKLTEWVTAVKLERLYTKEEIIALYFNTFDFLYQAVGIKSAARIYFNKSQENLKIEEAATLVGMAKNPFLFNPKKFPDRSRNRRNVVIGQMYRNGYVTREQKDSLQLLPLKIEYTKVEDHTTGIGQYFREFVSKELHEWFDKNPKPDGKKYNLYTDGLKIYTTLDSRLQRHAENAVKKHLTSLQKLFYEEHKNRKRAPYYYLNDKEIQKIIKTAVQRSERFKSLKRINIPKDSIQKIFNTPVKMKIFTWDGSKDTIMSPIDSIKHYKFFLQTGVLSVEPQTGFIKAWVGGNDFRFFKYDHVVKGKRQVGSTFKPLVYATAIDQIRYSPCHKLANTKFTIENWSPGNSDGKYGGEISLSEALAKSVNVITSKLIFQTGVAPVIQLAKELGITSKIPESYTIALGTADISVYEMVGAFASFANEGIYNKLISILRIEDHNGRVIYEARPQSSEVLSLETSFIMLELLKGVASFGTGKWLRTRYGFSNEIAGKTGTTQNNSDGWFIGMVPRLITGIWVGCEDRAAHFYGSNRGQGAEVAMPIWAFYMKEIYKDENLDYSKDQKFEKPDIEMSIELDCKKYMQNISDNDYLQDNF